MVGEIEKEHEERYLTLLNNIKDDRVFKKDGKYYCVPVYIADVYKGVLPNKAATAGKTYEEWPEMDDTYIFQFSMYKNDLLIVEHKKGIAMKKMRKNDRSKTPDEITIYKDLVYFNAFGIAINSSPNNSFILCFARSNL